MANNDYELADDLLNGAKREREQARKQQRIERARQKRAAAAEKREKKR